MTHPQPAAGARRRIWGWYFFDWASQPYNTLIVTFIFGPYIAGLIGDGGRAQMLWAAGIAAAGAVIALLSPLLGAIADAGGRRRRWVGAFSALYILGSAGLWWSAPDSLNLPLTLTLFALGLIGMEFATTFTNAWLPELAPRRALGRISGSGWAFGYLGGLVALALVLLFLAERPETGLTLAGLPPAFGLDPALREGTRAVGPLTALWYALFMLPFFLWVPDPPAAPATPAAPGALRRGLAELGRTLRRLPSRRSLSAFLLASMLYRDGLNAIYGIGGVYAAGVLSWGAVEAGAFGIVAILSGALFTWVGGRADARLGAKPVIVACIWLLVAVVALIAGTSRDSLLGLPLEAGSRLPDLAFLLVGALVGAAGGTLQAASRTLMVAQAEPGRMTEGFGLYALSGKATSFLAPALIAGMTWLTGSQQLGILPLIVLFLAGLVLLLWVEPAPAEIPLAHDLPDPLP